MTGNSERERERERERKYLLKPHFKRFWKHSAAGKTGRSTERKSSTSLFADSSENIWGRFLIGLENNEM